MSVRSLKVLPRPSLACLGDLIFYFDSLQVDCLWSDVRLGQCQRAKRGWAGSVEFSASVDEATAFPEAGTCLQLSACVGAHVLRWQDPETLRFDMVKAGVASVSNVGGRYPDRGDTWCAVVISSELRNLTQRSVGSLASKLLWVP